VTGEHLASLDTKVGNVAADGLLGDVMTDIMNETDEPRQFPRTATSGIVHRLLVFLTMIAFVGNAAFMVFVFWMSK
jgi:hypothetical protein